MIKIFSILILLSCFEKYSLFQTRSSCLLLKKLYFCESGDCIEVSKICDGYQDCIDGSDERYCTVADQVNTTKLENLQTVCDSELKIQCTDGECIERIKFCDGVAHCRDGSDETTETCLGQIPCRNGFLCKYGACISRKYTCNGITNCVDNSDESVEYAGCNATQIMQCTVPNILNMLMYRKLKDSSDFEYLPPGYIVESSMNPLYYECETRYTLRENNYLPNNYLNYCLNNVWLKRHPTCTKLCASADLVGVTFTASCNDQATSGKTDCMLKKYHLPGTPAYLTCQYNYEEPDSYRNILMCEEDGNWNYLPQRCHQKCGVLGHVLAPYIGVGGKKTDITSVPWQAAVFLKGEDDDYVNICGGTIINPLLIISAAHCFWNRTQKVIDHNKYTIVVGTTARNYENRNITSQTFSVKKIIPHDRFRGEEQIYLYDIALVVLNSSISFNSYVTPICINKRSFPNIESGIKGKFAGWGQFENNKYPNLLRSIELLSLSYDDCKYRGIQHLAADKFCLDTKNSTGSHVCYGDSGGGFVQKMNTNFLDKTEYKYFLRGILSTGFHTLSCSTHVIAGFTDINAHDYISFINEHADKYTPN